MLFILGVLFLFHVFVATVPIEQKFNKSCVAIMRDDFQVKGACSMQKYFTFENCI
jgi:hypothetical protein